MAEYIEREAAENAIRNDLPLSTWMKRSVDKAAHAMGVTVDAIEAPAADVVEVRHGRWIKIDGLSSDYYCSECNKKWWTPFPEEMHYCPNCGAKMDGGDE